MSRKILLILIMMLSSTLLVKTNLTTASIEHFAWTNPTIGEDLYYGRTVVAYKEGTPWNISISVLNDYLTPPPPPRIYLPINVTAIKIYFDWGGWYNCTFNPPVHMNPLEVKVFSVWNTTPSIAIAPEAWVHTYTVYVEYIVEGEDVRRTDWSWSGSNFAVMSEAHFECFKLYNKLKNIIGGITSMPLNSTEARILLAKALIEYNLGRQYYTNGAFKDARTHFAYAETYMNEALVVGEERGTEFEDAMLNYYNAMTEYYNSLANATIKQAEAELKQAEAQLIQANAALNNSYGWIFFGLGWTLIGIGVIVYGFRKTRIPKTEAKTT
ncbi:MAG: hypothetical protein QW161_05395 [Candidatus Bathyarchaeia archaeon]